MVFLVGFVLISLLSPVPVSAKRKTTRTPRVVTYTVKLPAKRSGELGSATPVLAQLVETPASTDREGFAPRGRPRVGAYSGGIGSRANVSVRGFWQRKPLPTDARVRVTITGPDGLRAYLLINGSPGESSVRDLFAGAADPQRPVAVHPDFSFHLRPRYPLGRYSVTAVANGRRAQTSFEVAVPPRPSGVSAFATRVRRSDPIVLTWAGYPPGSPIGLLTYVRRETSEREYAWEFFARFTPVPTDQYGSLEIDLPTDDAVPGDYCFATDEAGPGACRFSDGINVVSLY